MIKTLQQCKLTTKQMEICDRFNFKTCADVLSLYPLRYEQLTIIPYQDWQIKDKVCFEGIVTTYPRSVRFGKNKSMTKFQVESADDVFDLVIFNRPWTNNLKVGTKITIIGKYEGVNKVTVLQYNTKPLSEQLELTCIYPMKENMQQRSIHSLIQKVFVQCYNEIEEFVPSNFVQDYRLMSKKMALRCVHFPKSMEEVQAAYRTLKYEEFLKFQLAVQLIRQSEKNSIYTTGKEFDENVIYNLMDELPFECTVDQKSAILDILHDMKSNQIMYRLVQGDVGCGKTIVAWFAMVACVLSKHQAAMMAPTEILAKQHYESFLELAKYTNIKIEVLYSAMSSAKKNEVYQKLKSGEIDICIGTHALIQDSVVFSNLGLVVADEQHRFGVGQRKKLKEKGDKVDFIVMSATPIPRTLANTLYGDMDVSTIETMPAGRKIVQTRLIKKNKINQIEHELKNVLDAGRQIYVICAAIEESENFQAENVLKIAQDCRQLFAGIANVGVLHGKMNSEEKESIMHDFEENRIQILVSTTVVEVGVNVVNATAMVIMDAHRFGLSSLHQLRGRVQRGSHQGVCYLMTDSKEPESLARLQVLVDSHNGFEISLRDLQLRGPGDILGVRQSGIPGFILGNLFEDTRIIETAKKDAMLILENQQNSEYKKCVDSIQLINEQSISFMD